MQGGTNTTGRVEVCHNGVWGTVCDNIWGAANAIVACTQLGYLAIGAIPLTGSDVPDGSDPIWLDDVSCVGTESSLFNCNANPLGIHTCSHSRDAGVSCRK